MSKLIQPKPETTEDLSIDKLEAAVKTNKDLYDEKDSELGQPREIGNAPISIEEHKQLKDTDRKDVK